MNSAKEGYWVHFLAEQYRKKLFFFSLLTKAARILSLYFQSHLGPVGYEDAFLLQLHKEHPEGGGFWFPFLTMEAV